MTPQLIQGQKSMFQSVERICVPSNANTDDPLFR